MSTPPVAPHRATIRQAVVRVDADAEPMPSRPVGDRPFLAWVLRELCRHGVERVLLLAGAHAEALRATLPEIAKTLPRPLELQVIEPARAGFDERFLLLDGQVLFDANWAGLLADAAGDGPEVLARRLFRRDDDTGIAVVSRDVVGQAGWLEEDGFAHLAADGRQRRTVRDGWLVDSHTQAGFSRAKSEVPARFGRRPALILDRDGVLNVDHGYVGHRDRFEWTASAREAVRFACDQGWHVFVATNQSGVARGKYDEAAVLALYDWLRGELHAFGATIDDWRYCPTHPEGTVAAYAREDPWRKPGPGMLLDLLRAWRLDPAACVMIGDQVTDMRAAAAAGVTGHLFAGGDLLALVRAVLRPAAAVVA